MDTIGFKEFFNESKVDYKEKLQDLIGKDDKLDSKMWDWFEKHLGDSGIYAGDAVPEDYIEVMTDKQAKDCYTYISKFIK